MFSSNALNSSWSKVLSYNIPSGRKVWKKLGKGESAGNQHFLLFPLFSIIPLSANIFVPSKICHLVKKNDRNLCFHEPSRMMSKYQTIKCNILAYTKAETTFFCMQLEYKISKLCHKINKKIFQEHDLTLSQTTKFKLFQTERACRRQFKICLKWQKILQMGRKTLWEKEKLLITRNFSFSHSVFKRLLLQTRKNQGLFGKGLKLFP